MQWGTGSFLPSAVKQIEFQGTPAALDDRAQGVVAQQADDYQQDAQSAGHTCVHGQRVGDQPPDLPPENQGAVEAEQIVEVVVLGNQAQQVHHRVAGADIKHQISDALVLVAKAEAFKGSA